MKRYAVTALALLLSGASASAFASCPGSIGCLNGPELTGFSMVAGDNAPQVAAWSSEGITHRLMTPQVDALNGTAVDRIKVLLPE